MFANIAGTDTNKKHFSELEMPAKLMSTEVVDDRWPPVELMPEEYVESRTSKPGKPGKAGKTGRGKARPDECKQGRTRPYDAGKAQREAQGG